MFKKEEKYFIIHKKEWQHGNLGGLTASLKSSQKDYILFSDPSQKNRPIVLQVAIPLTELEVLDKATKPQWWDIVQGLKEEYTFTLTELEGLGDIFGFGYKSRDATSNIEDNWPEAKEFRKTTHANDYIELRKKF